MLRLTDRLTMLVTVGTRSAEHSLRSQVGMGSESDCLLGQLNRIQKQAKKWRSQQVCCWRSRWVWRCWCRTVGHGGQVFGLSGKNNPKNEMIHCESYGQHRLNSGWGTLQIKTFTYLQVYHHSVHIQHTSNSSVYSYRGGWRFIVDYYSNIALWTTSSFSAFVNLTFGSRLK